VRLWETYNRALLANARGLPTFITSYEDLLDDSVAVARKLSGFLETQGLTVRQPRDEVLRSCVDADLRHNVHPASGTDAGDDMTAMPSPKVCVLILNRDRRDDTLAQLATLPMFRRDQRARLEEAHRLMDTVGLTNKTIRPRAAGTLPYGDQRRLEIARALALKPRLLILDEPAAGMNPVEKDRVRDLIKQLNADGLTILLIDHDMRLVMGVCQQIAVLNFGRKIADGSPLAVSENPEVITAYLGRQAEKKGAHVPGAEAPTAVDPDQGQCEADVPDRLVEEGGLKQPGDHRAAVADLPAVGGAGCGGVTGDDVQAVHPQPPGQAGGSAVEFVVEPVAPPP